MFFYPEGHVEKQVMLSVFFDGSLCSWERCCNRAAWNHMNYRRASTV